MADFVEVPHASSSVAYIDETLLSRARSGTVRVRRLQSGAKRIFNIALRGLTPTRRDALVTLYNSKRGTTLTLAWAPTAESSITVVFGPNPIQWSQEADQWNADLELFEV